MQVEPACTRAHYTDRSCFTLPLYTMSWQPCQPCHGHGPAACRDVSVLAPTIAFLNVAALGLLACLVLMCRQNFEAAMAQQRAEIERLNNTLSTLRQERDRVIMVGPCESTPPQPVACVLAHLPSCTQSSCPDMQCFALISPPAAHGPCCASG